MAGELSNILEHIEKIGELDLDGVPPTTHVVEVANALRPDEPRPCLPREVALAQAPDVADGGFLVPSPHGMTRPTSSTSPPRRRPPPSTRGDLDRRELFEAYRDRAAADELNAYLWVADEAPDAATGGAARTACRSPSRTSSAPRACPRRRARGSSRATARPTRRPSSRGWPRPARRCWARPTRTSSRWARRTRTPAFGPVLNPWDRTRVPGRLVAAAAPPPSRRASRRGRWAPTPAARSASPPRCAASSASSPPTARSAATG